MTTPELDAFLAAVSSGNDELAEKAVQSLRYDGDETLDRLLDLAVSGDDDLRWWAVRALAHAAQVDQQQQSVVLPALTQALSDPDESLRCLAALSLGQLQAASTVPALMVLLADPSGWVRGAAADGLDRKSVV